MAQRFVTAVFVALMIVVLSVDADFSVDTAKCKFTAQTKTFMKDCYKEVALKDFDPATFKMEDLTADQQLALAKCISIKEGYLSADGKTLDEEKAKANIDTFEADAATKDALKAGVLECFKKGGDALTILKCNKDVHMAVCK